MPKVTLLVGSMLLLAVPLTAPADAARPASRPASPPATRPAWPCPVSVSEVDVHGSKPPLRLYFGKLEIKNPHDRPIWFVFRYWQDEPLEHVGGRLARPGDKHHILQGMGYDGPKAGGRGRVVVLSDLGHFRAVRVPARGSVRFDRFGFEASSPVGSVDVWEVESLRVNGVRPVEQWLPYDTMSGADTHIVGRTDPENLEWDRKTSRVRADLPKEKVRFVGGGMCWRGGRSRCSGWTPRRTRGNENAFRAKAGRPATARWAAAGTARVTRCCPRPAAAVRRPPCPARTTA